VGPGVAAGAAAVADGVAVGCGVAEPVGCGVAEPVGFGVPLGVAVGVGSAAPVSAVILRTLRKRSSAGAPSSLSSSFDSPARLITMLVLPSVMTSASVTPRALTRFSMICRACSSDSSEGGLPSSVVARIVTWVPPTRSRPSRGCSRSAKLMPLVPANSTSR
jgi:hypothetical protein